MRFTAEQKKELDETMTKFCNNLNNPISLSRAEISACLGYELTTTQIQASLNRIDADYSFISAKSPYEKSYFEISPMEDIKQYKAKVYPLPYFIKDKNILKIFCADSRESKNKRAVRADNYKLHYDFITKTFFVVDNTGERVDDVKIYYDEIKTFIDCKCLDYEWIYNYLTTVTLYGTNNFRCEVGVFHMVRDIIIAFKYYNVDCSAMPKGIFNLIEENNDILDASLVKKWYLSSLCETEKEKNFVNNNRWWSDFENFIPKLVEAKLKIKDFMKVISNSIETTSVEDISDFGEKFMGAFLTYAKSNKVKDFVFDTNRDLKTNYSLLEMACNKERFEALEKQLQKINFINGLTIGGYVVKVPQNQTDKIDEGIQQNNCVGYHYDDSIINGTNLIYFIRKMSNPNKSYITCRYNINSKYTVEYRYKNNADVRNSEEIEIIKKISEIIKNYLER